MVTDTVVVCWIDPDVPVTVTFEVVADPAEPLPLPPPQANATWSIAETHKAISRDRNVRFLFRTHKQAASAMKPEGNHILPPAVLATDPEVLIVTNAVTALPLGVTLEGPNKHDAPAGRPEQVKVTADLNPPCGVMVSVTVNDLPD